MGTLINPQHELFAELVAAGEPKRSAYFRAFPEARVDSGQRLMRDRDVAARVAELQREAAERHMVTVDNLAAHYRYIVEQCLLTAKYTDALKALDQLGKLYGLPSKQDVNVNVSFGGTITTEDAFEAKLAAYSARYPDRVDMVEIARIALGAMREHRALIDVTPGDVDTDVDQDLEG